MNISILKKNIERIIFFDIETTTKTKNLNELSENEQRVFKERVDLRMPNELAKFNGDYNLVYQDRGPLSTEFGKLVCISIGHYHEGVFQKQTSKGDEETIIKEFHNLVSKHLGLMKAFGYLCGQNIKIFDIPFLLRKMLQYNLNIPNFINPLDKKPWELEQIIDTKEMMSFGSFLFKDISLQDNLLLMNIDEYLDVKGADVYDVYWNQENGLSKIIEHCESDIYATARLFTKSLELFE